MSVDNTTRPRSAHIIVVGNEKGGSGKSTVAMNVAAALMKAGARVATIDMDARQQSFTHFIQNRQAWMERANIDLQMPDHFSADEDACNAGQGEAFLLETTEALKPTHDFIVIDTPGHHSDTLLTACSLADTLITPLNDSFVDTDVLGAADAETFQLNGAGRFAAMVDEARRHRLANDGGAIDWVVVRNRLSMLNSRNKRLVEQGLQTLSQSLDFRFADGLAERVVFRELFPRGLTAIDGLNEATLGMRPTMSHATAQREIETLVDFLRLPVSQGRADRPSDAVADAGGRAAA